MSAKRIAAVLVVRNEVDIVRLCVLHHLGIGCERIFVLDNGSSDGTEVVLQRLAARVPLSWSPTPDVSAGRVRHRSCTDAARGGRLDPSARCRRVLGSAERVARSPRLFFGSAAPGGRPRGVHPEPRPAPGAASRRVHDDAAGCRPCGGARRNPRLPSRRALYVRGQAGSEARGAGVPRTRDQSRRPLGGRPPGLSRRDGRGHDLARAAARARVSRAEGGPWRSAGGRWRRRNRGVAGPPLGGTFSRRDARSAWEAHSYGDDDTLQVGARRVPLVRDDRLAVALARWVRPAPKQLMARALRRTY